MILKTGIDIIEIPRIQAALDRHGERFLKRVFTELEVFECRGRAEALAVRFAAKEATSKALGTGIGPICLAGGGDPAQMERGAVPGPAWRSRKDRKRTGAGGLGSQPEPQPREWNCRGGGNERIKAE